MILGGTMNVYGFLQSNHRDRQSYRVSTLQLDTTHPAHLKGKDDESIVRARVDATQGSFLGQLLGSLENTNQLIKESEELAVQSYVDPESVTPEQVSLAAARANLAVSITQSVVSRGLEAYRSLISLR